MRMLNYLAAATVALLPACGWAADVSESGARSIETTIDSLLPQMLQGVLRISPAGDHYALRLDMEPALPKLERPLDITDMSPIDGKLTRRSEGIWNLAASVTDGWLIGDHFFDAQPSHFQLHAGSATADVTYDARRYLPTDFSISAKDLEFSRRAYNDWLTFSAATYDIVGKITEAGQGRLDVAAGLHLGSWEETMRIPELIDPLSLRGKSIDGAWVVKAENPEAIRRLAGILAARMKADTSHFTFPWREVGQLLKSQPVLFDYVQEKTSVGATTVTYRDIDVILDKLSYVLTIRGKPGENAFAFDISADHPSLKPGRFPAAVSEALPDEAGIGIELSGADLQRGLIAAADLGPQAIAEDQSKAFRQAVLPDGRLKIEFRNTYARSRLYDVAIAGWVALNPQKEQDSEADVTITARNVDEAVKFLQANASSVPQFGQASFMLLMAKGMARQEKDGTLVWHLQRRGDAKLMLNGRPVSR